MSVGAPARRASPTAARPGRDVAIALALKCALLGLLYLACFGPTRRPPSDAAATAAAMLAVRPTEHSR